MGAAPETRRRRHSAGVWSAPRRRRPRFAGRHHPGRSRPGSCPAVFVRRRHEGHAGMVPAKSVSVQFALGTIGIGKPWGFANPEVPAEPEALALLERAYALGVRYFDTAPSYGVSEARLGRFLSRLT